MAAALSYERGLGRVVAHAPRRGPSFCVGTLWVQYLGWAVTVRFQRDGSGSLSILDVMLGAVLGSSLCAAAAVAARPRIWSCRCCVTKSR